MTKTNANATKTIHCLDRGRYVLVSLALTLSLFGVKEGRSQTPPAPRPNILLIMADDLGFSDLGCYGGEIETPKLDQLAAEGIRFSQFYNCGVCRTTRASLMTGLHPRRANRGRLLHDDMWTLGEIARSAGYRTSLIGKWHFPVTKPMDKNRLPTRRGFDTYYGLAAGCCNYFNPAKPFPKNYGGQGPEPFLNQETPITKFPSDYYTTDDFSTQAVKQIENFAASEDGSPFFLTLFYTAPHYPLHAKPNDVAKYAGRYDDGYDVMRKARLRRLVELQLVRPSWKLSEAHSAVGKSRYDFAITPWKQVAEPSREKRRMEVYAAMVDSMDQGIGRVLAALDRTKATDNTLVMFLSDNGGCAGHADHDDTQPLGSVDTFGYVAQGWGWAQNAPFRRYKTWTHEGGIATPMIARWPAVIQGGTLTHEVGHVVDFMPTLLELTGAAYPEERDGAAVLPTEGVSFLPALKGKEIVRDKPLCWYLYGNRAVRDGTWKLVWGNNVKKWELYSMVADRTETNDVARQFPQRVKQMEAAWLKWAKATNAPLKGSGL